MQENFNNEGLIERTLTVINYGEDEGKIIKTRVTIAPHMVQTVVASYEPVQSAEGQQQHKVNVLYMDGNQIELFINLLDLTTLERATGIYFTP